VGTWKTQACDQSTDINGNPYPLWARGVYTFTGDGWMQFYSEYYLDSQCSLLSTSNPPNDGPSAVYIDWGEEIIDEGIPGHRLLLSGGSGSNAVSSEGFYTISNRRLCFSETFVLEPFQYVINQTRNDLINFNRCLIR